MFISPWLICSYSPMEALLILAGTSVASHIMVL
jgi:hypothetical protein